MNLTNRDTMMDFTTLDIDENLEQHVLDVQKSKQDQATKILAELNTQAAKRLGEIGMKLLQPAFANRVAKNPTTQEQYNARRFVIRAIIREPKRAVLRYPVKQTWEELYPNVPYWDKATSAPLQKFERQELKAFAKEQEVYTTMSLQNVQDFMAMVKLAHVTGQLDIATTELKEYRYLMDPEANAILYRGHVLKYSTRERAYLLKLGNKTLKLTEGNVRKQQEVFAAIDALEELCG